jgi:hypothetical protein
VSFHVNADRHRPEGELGAEGTPPGAFCIMVSFHGDAEMHRPEGELGAEGSP